MAVAGAPGFEINCNRFSKPEGRRHEGIFGAWREGQRAMRSYEFGCLDAPCAVLGHDLGFNTVPKKLKDGTVKDRH